MKIGDRVFIHGYVDEIRKETVIIRNKGGYFGTDKSEVIVSAKDLEPVVRCKDCKYFELDHFDRIDDIPLITAHEICTKWSGGCKTSKDGFCFMGERRKNV